MKLRQMADDQVNPVEESVPPLELMAALSSFLVHDFSNHLSIISGNAQFAQLVIDDPERVGTALKSIVQAGEMAAELLKRSGDLRRSLKGGFADGEISDLRNLLLRCQAASGGWIIDMPPTLTGRIALPPHWVALVVREMIRETAVQTGTVTVARIQRPKPSTQSRAPASESYADMVEIRIAYEAGHPFPFAAIRSNCANLALLAAYELILNAGGWANFERSSGNQQQPTLCVPVVGQV
jgi:hypothetical protein